MLGEAAHTAHMPGVTAGLFGTIDQVSVSNIKSAADHRDVRMTLASRNGPILPLIDNLADWRGPC
jgi:hypothetical protein